MSACRSRSANNCKLFNTYNSIHKVVMRYADKQWTAHNQLSKIVFSAKRSNDCNATSTQNRYSMQSVTHLVELNANGFEFTAFRKSISKSSLFNRCAEYGQYGMHLLYLILFLIFENSDSQWIADSAFAGGFRPHRLQICFSDYLHWLWTFFWIRSIGFHMRAFIRSLKHSFRALPIARLPAASKSWLAKKWSALVDYYIMPPIPGKYWICGQCHRELDMKESHCPYCLVSQFVKLWFVFSWSFM